MTDALHTSSTCSFGAQVVTDVGPVRSANEDSALLPGHVLCASTHARWQGVLHCGAGAICAVIDGMGGHGGGALASATAAINLQQAASRLSDALEPDAAWVRHEIQGTSDLMVDIGKLRPETQIMGATAVGLVLGCEEVIVFSIGDSRAYVLETGYLTQLTNDHRGRAGGLTRSLAGTGHRVVAEPDVQSMDRSVARRYLLCSDGLTDTLSFEEIKELINSDAAALDLVQAAISAGSHDNVTVMIIDVPAAHAQ